MLRRLCVLGLVVAAVVPALAQNNSPRRIFTFVHFRDLGNLALNASSPTNKTEDNSLKEFPQGEQKYDGVPFFIGDKLIHLGSPLMRKFPEKVSGIPVKQKCDKLYFLHATSYGNTTPPTAEGTEIAHYLVKYDDETEVKVPVEYGRDLKDWFAFKEEPKDLERGKLVWTGENENSKKNYSSKLRIYLTTWTNPNPAKKVESIDFVKTGMTTSAAPFCVGITAEAK